MCSIKQSKFPCHSCGACCMMVGDLLKNEDNVNPDYLDLVRDFPYKADESGWCEKLGDDLKCSIYETRPLLCRIEEVWRIKFSGERTKSDYFSETAMACKRLMKHKLGMNESQIQKVYDEFI